MTVIEKGPEPTPAEKLKRALVINRFESKCGACGQPADPGEKGHIHQLGYQPGEGCGFTWVYVTSDYTNMEEAVTEMRPDLEWFNRWPR